MPRVGTQPIVLSARRLLLYVLMASLGSHQSTLALDTVWNFDGNLNASFGTASLSYRGNMGSQVTFSSTEHDVGLPMPFGDHGGIMAFPATAPTQGLTVNLHNGGATVSNYTMIWDLFRPAPSWESWMPLLQTNIANTDDGDFFINPGDGIGISGNYDGTVTNARGNIAWNRIALTRAADGSAHKYIDGQLVDTQTLSGSRWNLTGGQFHILTDENNESSQGYLSSFRVVDRVLTQQEIGALGKAHAGGANVPGHQIMSDPALVTPGSFTVAIVGDTQNYSTSRPDIFESVTQWIADNADDRNIQFVIQDGDIVNNGNASNEWNVARAAMDNLNGIVPYAVVRGNHDVGSQFDSSLRFGNGSPHSQQPTLAGHYEYPTQPNWDMRNTFHLFQANDQQFLVLTVDILADAGVVQWANEVIAQHPNARVIIDTHAYLYDGGERFNNAVDPSDPQGRTFDQLRDVLLRQGQPDAIYNGAAYGGQDGETLWRNLISQHENVAFTISGHQFEDFDQFKYHLDEGDHGNTVHELLVDPQNMANGGNGWIRLLEFDPDGITVHVKTYSPFLNVWDTNPDVRYDIQMSPFRGPDGDFNGDGDYNCLDVDQLVANIVARNDNPLFDVTGDGTVDQDDLVEWLGEAGSNNLGAGRAYLPGDANLDGVVDGSDFGVWNSNRFTMVSAWCKGDFNASGIVDGTDFGIWNANKFTSSDSRVVPEPATIGLWLLVVAASKRRILPLRLNRKESHRWDGRVGMLIRNAD
jgi:Concanavalin A-like lectin/glucanases superfamily/Calcineurin-like phosphoesterase